MEIVQKDIFSRNHPVEAQLVKPEKVTASSKFFPKIDLEVGINEKQIQMDFVVIHRIIQNRLAKNINFNFCNLLKVFLNEARVKTGKLDPVTATRDSLLACSLKKS